MENPNQHISENPLRCGNFTSSEIYRLLTLNKAGTGFGAPALSYIAEKNLERKLGRTLGVKSDTRATLWGKFLEQRVHDLLPTSYLSVGNETLAHPILGCWAGSPDNICKAGSTVGDTKCYAPANFALYIDALADAQRLGDCELLKKSHTKEFWQLVSNAIITGMQNIEAIVYMPYESELPEIREMAQNYTGPEPWKYRFIAEADKCELAYLPNENKFYKNLNIYRFEVVQSDIDLLTEAVKKAGEMLMPRPKSA